MTLALIGLIGLQWVLLEHAQELKERTFRQNVNGALGSIVRKIETHETVATVVAITVADSTTGKIEVLNWVNQGKADSTITQDTVKTGKKLRYVATLSTDSTKSLLRELPTDLLMNLRLPDSLASDSVQAHKKLNIFAKARMKTGDSLKGLSYEYEYAKTDSTEGIGALFDDAEGAHLSLALDGKRRQMIISRVLDQLENAGSLPLDARIQPMVLDSIIKITLLENGIEMPYAYGIWTRGQKTLALAQPAEMQAQLLLSDFRTPLFPFDIFKERDELILYFPEQNIYMLKETGPLLAATIVLMSVIVFGFIYAVLTIFRQRRFADSLTTFINNMTHEFKTPISTISLAAEAMANPTATKDKKRLNRYTQFIRDENSRMRQQVEKILQMAVLEKGDYELNLAEIDIHDTIKTAIENIALQVEKRGGKIISDLRATTGKIKADAVHIANVIYNLLDNANKYTRDKPQITVSTRDDESGVHICVADNGIGLREEDRKRVFEKYFRVATGNVHDVKGFGLGLSYVRMMVEAHGGAVGVQSELGRGSTFDVFLPFTPNGSPNSNGRLGES